MSDAPDFVDPETAWIDYLTAQLQGTEWSMPVSNRTGETAPFVKLVSVGGDELAAVVDDPWVACEVYGVDSDDAGRRIQAVRGIIRRAQGTTIAFGVNCKRVRQISGVASLPDPDHEGVRYSWTFAGALRPEMINEQ